MNLFDQHGKLLQNTIVAQQNFSRSKLISGEVISANPLSPATNSSKIGDTINKAIDNFKESSKPMQFAKATALVGSAMLAFSGVKNLITPERTETGERVSSVWKQVGKITAAAALTYFAVLRSAKSV